ncbi:hypothetical protein MTO96_037188 [Rhipicephalus appendiculatus]
MDDEDSNRTNETTGVIATNGTLCSSKPSAAVVRHMFPRETFSYRPSKALAYTLGAQPIDFFVSLNKTEFIKEIKPVLERCKHPTTEENIESVAPCYRGRYID